jgi:hypothetical protein
MRPDVVLNAGEGRVEISKRPPRIIKRAAVAFREEDIGALVALPDLSVGLTKRHVRADVEKQRDRRNANRASHADVSQNTLLLSFTAAAAST